MSQLYDVLLARARTDPGAPVVTWYGPAGERAEMSAVTFATSVAKTAGVLLDEWEVPTDAVVRLDLPLHWQVPVWLAACDLAGLTVVWDLTAPADLVAHADPEVAATSGATFPVLVSVTPFGLQGAIPPPAPALDHARDAMGQPDAFAGDPASGRWLVDGQTWTASEICERGRELATVTGLSPGGRLLVTGSPQDPSVGLAVWPAPLVSGAGVVLCAAPDPAGVAAAEQVTAALG